MKQISVIINPSRLEDLKNRINRYWIEEVDPKGVSITGIMGYGNQKGHVRVYRGIVSTSTVLPKTLVEVVVPDSEVERMIEIVTDACRTGEIGDGKIFVQDVVDAVRIRTGERGDGAL
ncbi:MAG: P-II family nitrogen regulator [Lachnospiraceae bacterium]|jgi:nitrogen regulatory protein P-II 1|nr:P-II family nitrogen regulator [Lachnospiraceae bacterium]